MQAPHIITSMGDGVKIHLAEWSGREPTILCIHGITANCRCWDVIASGLAPDCRVLAMDLRGRGRSDKPATGYSVEQHGRDILALLEDLKLQRPVLMGHSLGAFIALAFAAHHSDRVDRLILVDGGGDLSKEQMDKVFAGIKPSLDRLKEVFPSTEAYVETMKQAPYIQPWSPFLETYYRWEIMEVPNNGVRTNIDPVHIDEEAANVKKMAAASLYPKIGCKVLILRATKGLLALDDILLPEQVVKRMASEMPHARYVDIDGVNHYGIVFQPNRFRDEAIRAFLKE
jgi:pimeloyl-ACP methyl ester carboxylesterase